MHKVELKKMKYELLDFLILNAYLKFNEKYTVFMVNDIEDLEYSETNKEFEK